MKKLHVILGVGVGIRTFFWNTLIKKRSIARKVPEYMPQVNKKVSFQRKYNWTQEGKSEDLNIYEVGTYGGKV